MLRSFFNSLLFVFVLCSANGVLADTPPENTPPKTPTTPTHTPEQIQAIVDENRRLKEESEKRDKKPDDDNGDDDDDKDLNKKVRDNRDAEDKKNRETKGLESALKFNLTSEKFIEDNKDILPKESADIFAQADKEKYDSAIEKSNATKSALVQSFFNIQSNVELLTPSQRDSIEDFNKLTFKGRQDKAHEVYQNIFEPTLAMIKQIKKAEEVGKSKGNYPNETEGDAAYREKLMAGSKKHFLGEK